METATIIHEIDSLPAYKRMFIVEHVIRSIRLNNQENSLEAAADRLYADYRDDKELTAFTQLDTENEQNSTTHETVSAVTQKQR